MPAEWEPHAATWIAWPHRRDDWPGKFAPIPWVYAEIVRHLHACERVRILVNDGSAERRCRQILKRAGVDLKQIDIFQIKTNRSWIRDFGPIFVLGPEKDLIVTAWRFSGWAKYSDWELDSRVAEQAAGALGLHSLAPVLKGNRVVLEGGSIDVNGQGLLLTTEECLLSDVQVRNPGLLRADVEGVFASHLAIRKTLWLGSGIAGDDTHGHVDDLARFVRPTTVVAALESNPHDPNFGPLQDNWQRLQKMTDLSGGHLEVVALPMPAPVIFAGQRLPASYVNFYIANDRVLVPTFNDPNDRQALGILGELFPNRKIVGIHSLDLVLGLGTIHCLTQQEPRV
jgi:agmatine deiminase